MTTNSTVRLTIHFLTTWLIFQIKLEEIEPRTIPKPNLNPAFTNDQNLPLATKCQNDNHPIPFSTQYPSFH